MKVSGTLNAVAEAIEVAIGPEDNSVLAQITGTWTGTLTPEVQAETDGPWEECRWLGTDADAASETTTANGNFLFLRVAGAQKARVVVTAWDSGEASVTLRSSRGMGVQEPGGAGAATEATLGAIETALADVATETTLAAVEAAVDGLETLLTAIDGRVDTLESLLAPLVPGGNLVDTTGTAGTPEQINAANSQPCRGVLLSNWSSNPIAAGFSNTVDVALKTGVQIAAGKSMFFPCTNTNQIWVDVTTNGDAYGGVYYT